MSVADVAQPSIRRTFESSQTSLNLIAVGYTLSSAADRVQQEPLYSTQIITGAKSSFLCGADATYTAGILAALIGAAIVFLLFPQ